MVRGRLVNMETKPTWTNSSFLVYTGGLTVLVGAGAGIKYLASQYGDFATALWALLFLIIVYGMALALLGADRWIPAGILAFVSVILWGTFIVYLFDWFGWNSVNADLGDFSVPKTILWILVLASASFDRMLFKFPFIRLISAVVFYALVVDVLTSGHGTWFTWVTLFVGFLYLVVGTALGKPSAFWLHLVGGALIGGALLTWFHTSDFDFAMISIFAVVFVFVGYVTDRSVWGFYGTIGFFAATIHYLIGSPTELIQGALATAFRCTGALGVTLPETCKSLGPHISPWSPALAFGLLGLWLILLGLLGRTRKSPDAVVVVETPVAPAA